MRKRLAKLLDEDQVRQIKMGTFHALCSRFLRKYASLVGLSENYTITDADERCERRYRGDHMLTNLALLHGFATAKRS